jgi:hypothetical protein
MDTELGSTKGSLETSLVMLDREEETFQEVNYDKSNDGSPKSTVLESEENRLVSDLVFEKTTPNQNGSSQNQQDDVYDVVVVGAGTF